MLSALLSQGLQQETPGMPRNAHGSIANRPLHHSQQELSIILSPAKNFTKLGLIMAVIYGGHYLLFGCGARPGLQKQVYVGFAFLSKSTLPPLISPFHNFIFKQFYALDNKKMW